jgi:hypothetical protein
MKLDEMGQMELLKGLQGGNIVEAEIEEEQMCEGGMDSTDFLQNRWVLVDVYLVRLVRSFKWVNFLEASLCFSIKLSPSKVYSVLAT